MTSSEDGVELLPSNVEESFSSVADSESKVELSSAGDDSGRLDEVSSSFSVAPVSAEGDGSVSVASEVIVSSVGKEDSSVLDSVMISVLTPKLEWTGLVSAVSEFVVDSSVLASVRSSEVDSAVSVSWVPDSSTVLASDSVVVSGSDDDSVVPGSSASDVSSGPSSVDGEAGSDGSSTVVDSTMVSGLSVVTASVDCSKVLDSVESEMFESELSSAVDSDASTVLESVSVSVVELSCVDGDGESVSGSVLASVASSVPDSAVLVSPLTGVLSSV